MWYAELVEVIYVRLIDSQIPVYLDKIKTDPQVKQTSKACAELVEVCRTRFMHWPVVAHLRRTIIKLQ